MRTRTHTEEPLANNNFDRMISGEELTPAKKTRRPSRKTKKVLSISFLAVGLVFLLLFTGLAGQAVQSAMLGAFGWLGIAYGALIITISAFSLYRHTHMATKEDSLWARIRRSPRARRGLKLGLVLLAVVVLLFLQLITTGPLFSEAEQALIPVGEMVPTADLPTITYGDYIVLCFQNGTKTAGGVLLALFTYPLLTWGFRVSAAILSILFFVVLFSLISPFWFVERETSITLSKDEVLDDVAIERNKRQPKRRTHRRPIPVPVEDLDADIDDIQAEAMPEDSDLCIQRALDELTQTGAYSPDMPTESVQDADSPLQFGERKTLVAEWGKRQERNATASAEILGIVPTPSPEPESVETTNKRQQDSFDILFGTPAPAPKRARTPVQSIRIDDTLEVINPRPRGEHLPRKHKEEEAVESFTHAASTVDVEPTSREIEPAALEVDTPQEAPVVLVEEPVLVAVKETHVDTAKVSTTPTIENTSKEEPPKADTPIEVKPFAKPTDYVMPPRPTGSEIAEEEAQPYIPTVHPYTAPPHRLLHDQKPPQTGENYVEMYGMLEDAFASYGFSVRVIAHTRGPSYTQYAVQLPDGVSYKRVQMLEEDITRKINVETPVKFVPKVLNLDAIGVEIVNEIPDEVALKPLLTNPVFGVDKKLCFALGVDVMGQPFYCDILKGPHMMIAGSSGSGKSVCLNTLICSVLYNYKPDYVKFILVDPKGGVEMSTYNDLPHNMLGRAAVTPGCVLRAFDWAIEEMGKRYEAMRKLGVRSLGAYNDIMLETGRQRLPYILVIVDELADLMNKGKKIATEMTARLADLTGKARACGIHVIVATQRPSVDVITGTVKNNIPMRVALKTATQIDSKTILERGCAEHLIGHGDMYFMGDGSSKLQRLQGPFLSDDEVNNITDFIRANNESSVDEELLNRIFREEESAVDILDDFFEGDFSPIEGEMDEFLPRAVVRAADLGSISITRIEREFRIGFPRAASILDTMCRMGIVEDGAPGSTRPRRVLVTPMQAREIAAKLNE